MAIDVDKILSQRKTGKIDVDSILAQYKTGKIDVDAVLANKPTFAEGEDVSRWHTPLLDVPRFLQMPSPDEASDEFYRNMAQLMHKSGQYLFTSGASANIQGADTALPGIAQKFAAAGQYQPDEAFDASDLSDARLLYGGFYGAMEEAKGLTTPFNLALLFGTVGVGTGLSIGVKRGVPLAMKAIPWAKLGQGLMSLAFAANMGKELPAQFDGLREAVDMAKDDPSKWADIGRGIAHVAIGGTFTLGAFKGGARELRASRLAFNDLRVQKAEANIETRQRKMSKILGTGVELEDKTEYRSNPVEWTNSINESLDLLDTETVRKTKALSEQIKVTRRKSPSDMSIAELNRVIPEDKFERYVDARAEALYRSVNKRPSTNPATAELSDRQLNRIIERGRDYGTLREIKLIKSEAENLRQNLLADFELIAFESGKALKDYRIPYDAKNDIRYKPSVGRFEIVPVKMGKDANIGFSEFKRIAKNKKMYKPVLEALEIGTDGSYRRFSGTDFELLNARLSAMHKWMTPEEIQATLVHGDVPPLDYDGTMTNFGEWSKFRTHWIESMFRFLERLGLFGRQARQQMLECEMFVNTNVQRTNSTAQILLDRLGNKTATWRRFMENWVEAERTGIWPENAPHKDIMDAIRSITTNRFREMAIAHDVEIYNPVTGKKIPFKEAIEGSDYYLPRVMGRKSLQNMNKESWRANMQQDIMALYGKSATEAMAMVDEFVRHKYNGVRDGNLEYARIGESEDWLGNPKRKDFSIRQVRDMLTTYTMNQYRRLGDLHYYQAKGGGTWDFAKELGRVPAPLYDTAKRVIQTFRGVDNYNNMTPVTVRRILNIQVLRKMGLSSIMNSMQPLVGAIPLAARNGLFRTLRDIAGVTRELYKEGAFRPGGLDRLSASMGEAIEQTLSISGRSWTSLAAKGLLKGTLFEHTELLNRVFSERLGERYVQYSLDFLHNRSESPKLNQYYTEDKFARRELIKELKFLGISDETINTGVWQTKKWGNTTMSEKVIAAINFSRLTQFRSTTADVPLKWNGQYRKLLFQFKNFTFNQARLVNRHIIRPFLQNPNTVTAKPLLTWIGGAAVSHGSATYVKQWIIAKVNGRTSREQDDTAKRMILSITAESPFYPLAEIYNAAQYSGVAAMMTGVTGSDVALGLEGVVQGNERKIKKALLPVPFKP